MIFNDMQERITFNSKACFNIIKLVWAVLILYFWLKLWVANIWEDMDFLVWKYYEEVSPIDASYSDDWVLNMGMHNITDVEQEEKVDTYSDLDWENHEFELKYQTLCLSDFDLCLKVKFVWDISSKDKFMYFASTMYVFNNISNNIKIWKNINTQTKVITINSSYGATRWSADWNSVTIHLWAVKSYVEFLWLVSHELWHVVDLWVIQGYSSEKDPVYTEFWKSVFAVDDPSLSYYSLSWNSEKVRKSEAVKEDFCSWYGMIDPFEDFAECHNMYLNHNEIFKSWAKENEIMKQKYNFFANLYGGKFMFSSTSDLVKFNADKTWRPWDTTKM